MLDRSATGAAAVALAIALMMTVGGVHAFDDAKYPNWKGQWSRVTVPGWIGLSVHSKWRRHEWECRR
jgi:hypothetical protein